LDEISSFTTGFFLTVRTVAHPQGESEIKVRVEVPKELSERAARHTETWTPPILILQGIETGYGEGLSFQVLGQSNDKGSAGHLVLAETGIVGQKQTVLRKPLQKINLTVPLNEKSIPFLADQKEVTLTLKINDAKGRPVLKVARAYFQTAKAG
jgi:hypothetical protein